MHLISQRSWWKVWIFLKAYRVRITTKYDKPLGIKAVHISEAWLVPPCFPLPTVGVGPACSDKTLLSAIASALHTSPAPVTGQLTAAVEKNPGVWLNTAQPLCKAFVVTDDDIRWDVDTYTYSSTLYFFTKINPGLTQTNVFHVKFVDFCFLLLGDYYDEYHGWMSLFIDVKQVFSSYNIRLSIVKFHRIQIQVLSTEKYLNTLVLKIVQCQSL